MQLQCAECGKTIDYSGDAPKYCGFCGRQLGSTADTLGDTEAFGSSQPPRDMGPVEATPQSVGPYRLLQQLGQGGMGVVYEAEQADTGRRVAVKLLPRHVHSSPEAVDRFMREGQIAAALSHPRSTFIYAAGEDDGQFYISMELMTGGTVKDEVDREGPLPVSRAVDAMLDVMAGLEAAHSVGIIHRDVKPTNCFMDRDGRVKVGDYGLSKSLVSDASLTRTGAFLGTPQFAAPEQLKGDAIDARTDIYAVGGTLYFLLTGKPPFEGDAARVISAIASDSAARVNSLRPEVPRELADVIAQCLLKDPARRPQNLEQLQAALLPFGSRGTSAADLGRRTAAFFIDLTLAIFLLSVIALLIAGIMFISRGSPSLVQLQTATLVTSLLVLCGYFAISEGYWGCGVGKWLMGLRVVGSRGERPGVAAATLRSLLIPGLIWVFSYLLPMTLGIDSGSMQDAWQRASSMLLNQSLPLLGWLCTLGCLVTIRSASQYRGLHELLSGTRVVRVPAQNQSTIFTQIPITVSHVVARQTRPFGNYQANGTIYASGPTTVYHGHDITLGRDVWLLVCDQPEREPPPQRLTLSRVGRARWLQGGQANRVRWDAFEPVHGSPLTEVLESGGDWSWSHLQMWLEELVEELIASIESDTLPGHVSLSHVWVDRSGRIKLLDVAPSIKDLGLAESSTSQATYCVRLLRSAAQACANRRVLPGHAMDLIAELERRSEDKETLDWFYHELGKHRDRPSTLTIADRIGMLAVSFSVEITIFSMLSVLIAVAMGLLGRFDMVQAAWIAVPICITAPFLIGSLFEGGPVFWFMGIEVRRQNRRKAGWLRCGWRNFVAWLPGSLSSGMMAAWLSIYLFRESSLNQLNPMMIGSDLLIAALAVGLPQLLQLLGAVYAACFPTRGLQDWLAGTFLAPH